MPTVSVGCLLGYPYEERKKVKGKRREEMERNQKRQKREATE